MFSFQLQNYIFFVSKQKRCLRGNTFFRFCYSGKVGGQSGKALFTFLLSQLIFTSTNGSDDTAIDEQVGAGDELGMFAEQEGCGFGNLVAGASALGG